MSGCLHLCFGGWRSAVVVVVDVRCYFRHLCAASGMACCTQPISQPRYSHLSNTKRTQPPLPETCTRTLASLVSKNELLDDWSSSNDVTGIVWRVTRGEKFVWTLYSCPGMCRALSHRERHGTLTMTFIPACLFCSDLIHKTKDSRSRCGSRMVDDQAVLDLATGFSF